VRILLLTCCTALLCGCVWVSEAQPKPHANLKVAMSEGSDDDVLLVIERVATSLGYEKEPNDWEKWVPILSGPALENKRKEATYKRDGFSIMYMPELTGPYRDPPVLHLHFYEEARYIFSERGFAAFQELETALRQAGLTTLEEDEIDRKHHRPVTTPAAFNQDHPPPSLAKRAKRFAYAAFVFVAYGLTVVFPAFWLGLRFLRKRAMTVRRKRAIFVSVATMVLPPAPLPLSMFGPILLVPSPLVAPFMLEKAPHFISWFVGSTLAIAAIASLASLMIRATEAQPGAPGDGPRPAGSAGA
jgi:hypothetical protein